MTEPVAPDWVTRRAASANIDTSFEELRAVVKRDVESANREIHGGSGRYTVVEPDNLPMRILVQDRHDPSVWVGFINDDSKIVVEIGHGSVFRRAAGRFEVVRAWDKVAYAHFLALADDPDKPLQPWEISQRALEPLFFDD